MVYLGQYAARDQGIWDLYMYFCVVKRFMTFSTRHGDLNDFKIIHIVIDK